MMCGPAVNDGVVWEGRAYVVRGFEPMSIPDRRVELEDVRTGERLRVPVDALATADALPLAS